jgi:pimeloyl-ACP methyl ester carboxylesterase
MRCRTKLLLGFSSVLLVLLLLTGAFLYLLLHRAVGHYFDSNGARIFYTVEGSGPPVILIHGVAANADLNWRRPGVVRALAKHFQVITFDLRGHGLSDKPEEPEKYGIQMVEDITRLMDHLKLPKAHIAGYSLGGFIALKATTLHPDRFMSVAICAAGWKNPEDPSPIPSPYRPPEPNPESLVQRASVFAFAAPKPLFNRIRNRIGDWIMDPEAKRAIKKSYMDLAVQRPALEGNQVPVLCIIGTQDGFLYLARDLAAVTSNIESQEIPGVNHFTMPFSSSFKDALRAFFSKHAA